MYLTMCLSEPSFKTQTLVQMKKEHPHKRGGISRRCLWETHSLCTDSLETCHCCVFQADTPVVNFQSPSAIKLTTGEMRMEGFQILILTSELLWLFFIVTGTQVRGNRRHRSWKLAGKYWGLPVAGWGYQEKSYCFVWGPLASLFVSGDFLA